MGCVLKITERPYLQNTSFNTLQKSKKHNKHKKTNKPTIKTKHTNTNSTNQHANIPLFDNKQPICSQNNVFALSFPPLCLYLNHWQEHQKWSLVYLALTRWGFQCDFEANLDHQKLSKLLQKIFRKRLVLKYILGYQIFLVNVNGLPSFSLSQTCGPWQVIVLNLVCQWF